MNIVEKEGVAELWHKRLGHINEKGMKKLIKKNVLSGVNEMHLNKYSDFLVGKHSRVVSRVPLLPE